MLHIALMIYNEGTLTDDNIDKNLDRSDGGHLPSSVRPACNFLGLNQKDTHHADNHADR